MIDAFNWAEEYRTPVIYLMDGEIGHMRETLTMPDPRKMVRRERRLAAGGEHAFGGDRVPPMIHFGSGEAVHITGSTHKSNGMRDVETQGTHDELVTRLVAKIADNRSQLARMEVDGLGDAEIAVISYGASARPARGAVLAARKKGLAVAYIRLITLWPFPQDEMREIGRSVRAIVVPEMNLGQLYREIERFVDCPVIPASKIGGVTHTIAEISRVIEQTSGDVGNFRNF
jgi:2-oxoglutarate ferredoxin oxidoreductase subunit alpha